MESSDTLPDAIRILREWSGSHDRLGEMLGTKRQTVIRWEQGARPQDRYRDQLVSLGVPERLFLLESRAHLERRLGRVEDEVAEIRRLLEAT